jgi:hypothetical protein
VCAHCKLLAVFATPPPNQWPPAVADVTVLTDAGANKQPSVLEGSANFAGSADSYPLNHKVENLCKKLFVHFDLLIDCWVAGSNMTLTITLWISNTRLFSEMSNTVKGVAATLARRFESLAPITRQSTASWGLDVWSWTSPWNERRLRCQCCSNNIGLLSFLYCKIVVCKVFVILLKQY